MINLSKLRWPYREDKVFSALSFIVLVVPVIFCLVTNENFETAKWVVWLVFFGWALMLWVWVKVKIASHPNNKLSLITPLRFKAGTKGLAFALCFFLFWALLSALLAPDRVYSFFGFYYRFTNSFLFFLLWTAFFLVLTDVLDRQKWIFLIKLLAIDALLVALKGFLESMDIGLYQGLATTGFFRSPSLLGNPNFSSMFIAVILPFVAALWQSSRKFWLKCFYAVATFFMVFSLIVLSSRGALIALGAGIAAALVLFGFVRIKGRIILQSAFLAGLILFLGLFVIQVSRPDILHWDFAQANVDFRLKVWQQSYKVGILRHPLFGVGLGNFAIFHEHVPRPVLMGVFDDPHNLWIFLAATGGLPLLLCFFYIILAPCWASLKKIKQQPDIFSIAALAATVVFMVAASFTPVPVPLFLVLAVILAGLVISPETQNFTASLPGGKILALAAAVVFIVCGVCLGAGEVLLHFGQSDYSFGRLNRAAGMLSLSKNLNPTSQLSRAYLIYSEIKQKQNPEKIESEIKALKNLHPAQANSYVLAGDAYFNFYMASGDGRYLDAAITNLSQALSLDPGFPERYGELGFFYYLKNDFSQALYYLRYSLSLKPDLRPSKILEVRIYQQQGRKGEFLKALEEAYKISPDSPQLRYLWFLAKHEPDINQIPINVYFPER